MNTLEKKQEMSEQTQRLLNRSDELQKKALSALLELDGKVYDLGEWVTVKTYAERFGLDAHVVYNWVRRGKVPFENVIIVKELKELMLIKAISYKD